MLEEDWEKRKRAREEDEEENNEKARLEEFRTEKMKNLEVRDRKVEEQPVSEEEALLNEPDMFRKPSRTRARENNVIVSDVMRKKRKISTSRMEEDVQKHSTTQENCGSQVQGAGSEGGQEDSSLKEGDQVQQLSTPQEDCGSQEQEVGSEGVQDESSLGEENRDLFESLDEKQISSSHQEEYQDERSHHDKSVQNYDQSANQSRLLSGEEKVPSTEGPMGRPSWSNRVERMPRKFQKDGKVKKRINQGPNIAWWLTWWTRMEAEADEQYQTRNKITGYFGHTRRTNQMQNLTPIKLPATSCSERVQTHTPIQKSPEIQVQVTSQSRKCLSARRRVNSVIKEHHLSVGRIANPSPKPSRSGAKPKSIFSGKKRERVGGCESPAKRNKLDFRKLLNFWDGQTKIEDSTIDLDLNVIKERHPTKKHLNTDNSSAISGKESNGIM